MEIEPYNIYDIDEDIPDIKEIFRGVGTCSKHKIKYYNCPNSFDIETTSYYDDGEMEKYSWMYHWQIGLNHNTVVVGRTWDTLISFLQRISEELNLSPDKKRLIIYVHNLAFEFQFLRKHLKWVDVFAADNRQVIYAVCDLGIEFKCSYFLSGESLSSVAKHLTHHKIEKMVGDLDYTLIRTHLTPMTEQEKKYCYNDVLIVMYYIQEKIESDGKITKIPLTKTGYVRNYCRKNCLCRENFMRYRSIINQLTLEVNEYKELQRAFQGGFTHANPHHVFEVCKDVTSEDFISSYPATMVCDLYPMSKGRKIEIKTRTEMNWYLERYCCLFDIKFIDIDEKVSYEHPLSISRCWDHKNAITENGRVCSADMVTTTITDVDFDILQKFYKWSKIYIANFIIYEKGYLPTPLVKSILKLYHDKTTLKGVKGCENEYQASKELLNSCYGSIVTNICREKIEYLNDDWYVSEPDVEEEITRYNKSKNRYLFYPWGVWVTAYARHNLFTGIWECKNDYIYSDTDSIKIYNVEKHKDYIDRYNMNILKKIDRAADHHGIHVNEFCPVNNHGDIKVIGQWGYDGHYTECKFLGAKRYLVTNDDGEHELTVSGLHKKLSLQYLEDEYGDDIYSHFNDGLVVPKEYTGKTEHLYIDDEINLDITDYRGHKAHINELSGIFVDQSEYSLKLSDYFINYILSLSYGGDKDEIL